MKKYNVPNYVRYKKDAIWEAEEYQFVLSELTDGNNKFHEEKIFNMDAWLTFFGIWIAEGWTSNSVQIAANKQRVKDALNSALPVLGYVGNLSKDDKMYTIELAYGRTIRCTEHYIGKTVAPKEGASWRKK